MRLANLAVEIDSVNALPNRVDSADKCGATTESESHSANLELLPDLWRQDHSWRWNMHQLWNATRSHVGRPSASSDERLQAKCE